MKNTLKFLTTYINDSVFQEGLATKVVKEKRLRLEAFATWLGQQSEEIFNDVVESYEGYLKNDLKLSLKTVDKHLKDVNAFFQWLASQELAKPKKTSDFVVGLGASAGGLEALERFFGSDLVNPKLTYVVIQHLSPDFKSMMPEILSRVTTLPIHSIENGMEIKPGHVYLNNPRSDVRINKNTFEQVAQASDSNLHLPINNFFRSLALNKKDQAIGIILSGTGRDGSVGVSEIHEQGGLVLAQDSKSAVYASMPDSAAVQGPAHLVLNPSDMARAINEYVETGVLPQQEGIFNTTGMTGENAFSYLLSLLQRAYGIDFTVYKNATLVRRVDRRMNLGNYLSLEQYVSKLQENPEELDALYRDMLVDVTSFFRDEDAFKLLQEVIIPDIISKKSDRDSLRIWTAACASGEETYSLAILFQEEINRQGKLLDLKVFATDAHKDSILRASVGIFSSSKVETISKDLREKYFEEDDGSYKVSKDIRQKIIFAPHNLLSDGNFSNLDFVSCRNMLIYLRPEAQVTVLTQFSNGLNKDGILFLGSSEHLGTLRDYYEVINEKWRIFRKVSNLPINQGLTSRLPTTPVAPQRSLKPATNNWEQNLLKSLVNSGFVVDAQGQLIEVFGEAKEYIAFRAGRVNLTLTAMLDEPLATTVKSGLHSVQNSQEALTLSGIKVHEAKDDYVNLRFVPFEFSQGTLSKKYYLVQVNPANVQTFEEITEVTSIDLDRMVGLERELEFTRESLQATLEEVETTNEELQSTNEELIASNEELQSTNEELSSVNEELITVNNEYQAQNKRLNQTNTDLENLMLNTETLAIFLGQDLRIRMITPSAYEEFELLESDIDRPIHHFAHFLSFADNSIDSLCEAALKGERTNLSVVLRDQRQFELSVLPYKTTSGSITGVVLRFFDASELLELAKEPLQMQVKLFEQLSGLALDAAFYIYDIETDFLVYSSNPPYTQLGYSESEWEGFTKGASNQIRHVQDSQTRAKHYKELSASPDGTSLYYDYRLRHKDGHWLWFRAYNMVAQRNEDGKVTTVMGYLRNLEQERQLSRYDEFSKVLFSLSSDCIKILDKHGNLTDMNPNGCKLMGIDDFETIKGQPWRSLWPEPDVIDNALKEAQATGFSQFEAYCPTAKGEPKWWDVQVMRTLDPHSSEISFVSSSKDITKFKQAEQTYKEKVALEEKLEFAESLQKGNPSMTYVYDVSEDKNVYATGEVTDFLGYSSSELQALGSGLVAKLMHPDDLAKFADHQQELATDFESKQHVFNYRMKHKQGHWVHFKSIDSVFKRDEQSNLQQILGHVINLDYSDLADIQKVV